MECNESILINDVNYCTIYSFTYLEWEDLHKMYEDT